MRDVARVLLALLAGLAVVAGLACFALVVGEADRDTRDGGWIVGGALLVLAAGLLGVRRLVRPATPDPLAQGPGPRPGARDAELPIVLRPSRGRFAVAAVACFVLADVFALFAVAEPLWLLGALACGVGAVACGIALLPGRVFLRLDEEGILLKGAFATRRWRWDDVEGFRVVEHHHRYGTVRQVAFDERRLTPQTQAWWQTLGRGVTGADRVLPTHMGMDPEDLAPLLERLRERHATDHGPSPSARADEALRRAADAIPKDRVPVVTLGLATACLAAYAWQVAEAGWSMSAAELLDLGGASAGAPAWTLLTANVLHAGPLHLLLNLVALLLLGVLLEREIGWPRTAMLVLVGGVVAMGAATALQGDAVTVGVSGIVLALLGWALRRDPHRTRSLGTVAWSILPVALLSTLLAPGTSLGAHAGGLAVGLLLAWPLSREPGARRTPAAA